MKKLLGKKDKILISKSDLLNLCDYLKNDKEKMQKINSYINIIECNPEYDYLEIDDDCDLVKDLEKIEKIFRMIRLIENAILFSIINQDIVMKYRFEYLYKKINEKQTNDYQLDILEELSNEPELKQYIEKNLISSEFFYKNKQYIKSMKNNQNR